MTRSVDFIFLLLEGGNDLEGYPLGFDLGLTRNIQFVCIYHPANRYTELLYTDPQHDFYSGGNTCILDLFKNAINIVRKKKEIPKCYDCYVGADSSAFDKNCNTCYVCIKHLCYGCRVHFPENYHISK